MGVPVPAIMSISGHLAPKSFIIYIKATGEGHEQKMKRFWDEKQAKDEPF